jgi:hypothetical protein
MVAVSCSGGGDDNSGGTKNDTGPVPLVEAATRGPGAPLPNRFHVAAGSTLLGDAFPSRDGIPGWAALFIVTGDPQVVIDSYLNQGRAAGLELRGGRCGEVVPGRNAPEIGLECIAYLATKAGDPKRVSVTLRLRRAPKAATSPPLSHLEMEYVESSAVPPGPSQPFERGGSDIALPRVWNPLPRPGEQVARRYRADRQPFGVVVVRGSELIGPPADLSCGEFDGFAAVIAVSDDFDRVLREYASQLGLGERNRTTFRDYENRVVIAYGSEVVGINDPSRSRRILLVRRCYEHG